MLLGNVYCSREGDAMSQLETGTLFIRTKTLEETAEHVSRLSIRLMLNGRQLYRVGKDDHLITSENYLVLNQGQRYRTTYSGTREQEMILVAFQPGFAEGLLHTMLTPEDQLLDEPFFQSDQPVRFFEKTYQIDPQIHQLFMRLRSWMDEDLSVRQQADVGEIYTQLLLRLLAVHRNVRTEINRIGSCKLSTRVELYRRLQIAKDYLDADVSRRVQIDEVSRVACLSMHHFKRAFKELFGITPHRYHLTQRLQMSRTLLEQQATVSDVCLSVGFEDVSAFIRAFRQQYHRTPGEVKVSCSKFNV